VQLGLFKTNVTDGIVAYSTYVEMIEVLCKSANWLNEEYDASVTKYIGSDEHKKQDKIIQISKLSNYKLKLIMQQVFNRSPSNEPLRYTKKKEEIE